MARLKASKYRERYKGAFSRIAEAEYSVASLSALRYLGEKKRQLLAQPANELRH
jgi:hypothetical protein